MPMYDYRCPTCGSRFERFLRLTESDSAVPCPHCGTPKTLKQLSSFAVLGGGGSATSSADCAPSGS